MCYIFSDCWTRSRRGQKAHIYTTSIYLTIGPQISLYFRPSPSCTTDLLALRTKIHIFTADIYVTIGPQCTIYFQTAGPEAVEDKRPTFTLQVYIWPLALKLVYIIFSSISKLQNWLAGSEDKDPHFPCRYICDHWPSMYYIFSDCWTRCRRGQKAHIYTTSIYLTIGPQISLYFRPSPSCTTDLLALRTKIHIFTADIYVTIGPQCTLYFQTAGPDAVEDKRPTFTLQVYIWPLALKLVYIFIHLQAAQLIAWLWGQRSTFSLQIYMWPLALNVLYIFRLVDQMP